MRLKRLEIKAEYDDSSMSFFHTDEEDNIDPPTIISIDGQEYEGIVTFRLIDKLPDIFEIIITPIKDKQC